MHPNSRVTIDSKVYFLYYITNFTLPALAIFSSFLYFASSSGIADNSLFLASILIFSAEFIFSVIIRESIVKYFVPMLSIILTIFSFETTNHLFNSPFNNLLLALIVFQLGNIIVQYLFSKFSVGSQMLGYVLLHLNRLLVFLYLVLLSFKHIVNAPFIFIINERIDASNIYLFIGLASLLFVFFMQKLILAYRNIQLSNSVFKLEQISSWSLNDATVDNTLITKEGELKRKYRSILFGDIRGFTAFFEDNKPEVVVEILEEFYEIVEEVIWDFRGQKPEFIADEFITYFDSSEDAVNASLKLNSKINDLLEKSDLSLGLGIDSGYVLEGIIGSNKSKKYTVLGKSVNAAARLQAKAKGRQILISESIRNRVPNLDTQIMSEIHLKGIDEKFQVFAMNGYKVVEPKKNKTNILKRLKQKFKPSKHLKNIRITKKGD